MCLHFAFLFSVALCVNCNCAYSMFMLEHNGSMLFYGEASVQVVRRQAGKNLLASYFKVSYELMNCTKTWLFSIFWKLSFLLFFHHRLELSLYLDFSFANIHIGFSSQWSFLIVDLCSETSACAYDFCELLLPRPHQHQ